MDNTKELLRKYVQFRMGDVLKPVICTGVDPIIDLLYEEVMRVSRGSEDLTPLTEPEARAVCREAIKGIYGETDLIFPELREITENDGGAPSTEETETLCRMILKTHLGDLSCTT